MEQEFNSNTFNTLNNSQTLLIQKLILNLIPALDARLTENYTSYFLRLLNSRLNISTNNETNIMTMILERVSKLSNSYESLEKVERVQTLYNKLLSKKTLKRRWALLYLLLRISSDSEIFLQDSSKILQTIFHNNHLELNQKNSLTINNPSKNQFYFEEEEEDQPDLRQNNNSTSNIVVNNKSTKIITERDLINDLIFVFQGIDGHYINFNSISNAYSLNPLIPFNDNIFDIVSTLSELGWLYRKVNNHLKFFTESNIPSQFIQSFSYSIQSELSEYYKLISLFKKMNTKFEEGNLNPDGNNGEDLSLKKLILWTFEPLEKMKWLAISCEAVYSKF
jgi:gamma-tubulin complex component 3